MNWMTLCDNKPINITRRFIHFCSGTRNSNQSLLDYQKPAQSYLSFCMYIAQVSLPFRCINGATCVDGHQNYTCACRPGYEGRYCESVTQRCREFPCVQANTELCQSLFPADYRCVCKTGWGGKNCSDNVDDCASDPCLNSGNCTDLVTLRRIRLRTA